MKNKPSQNENDGSISDLIHRIKTGILDPGLLKKEQRQQCVESLYFESVSPSAIAQFLKVTDRTIRRDLADIRVKNALTPDPDLARQIVGEFMLFARIHRGNLMKLARRDAASVAERTQAEYYASMVGSDLIVKLQSLGYLPKSADALLVMQKQEENKSSEIIATLCGELDDMARVASDPGQTIKWLQIKEKIMGEGPDEE